MPVVHECGFRGCHRICPIKYRYCKYHYAIHKQQWTAAHHDTRTKHTTDRIYNRFHRDKEANKFYHSKQWIQIRNYVKIRDMMISGVSGRVLSDHDYIVDHIIPRRLCHDPYDDGNLWLLSRREHNAKTKIEESLPDSKLIMMTKAEWIRRLKQTKN